jgi:MFS family permease
MQSFAVSWEATAFGAEVAGLVATIGVLPRALTMLIGGAVADRYGIRRIMIICDLLMSVVVVIALALILLRQPRLPVIIGLALVGSAISAFYLPAAGGFIRLFIPDERLPVILPRVSGVQQIARLAGPALGAVVVVTVGLSGALTANLVTFGIILLALIMVRPPRQLPAQDPAVAGSGIGQILAGIRQAGRTPGMIASLGALGLVACGVLPVIYLGVPLLAREAHWGAPAAGWIEGAWVVGSLAVTLIMARYGAYRRIGSMIMIGPIVAAAGGVVIAAASNVPAAVAGSILMGIGTALFTGHLGPLYLSWTPAELTARFQALFGIVQTVPMVLINATFGVLAASFGARPALAAAALLCLAATLVVLSSKRLSTSTRPDVPAA